MLGAIVGDIVGSVYEFHNLTTKEFELFTPRNFFTDDSVLTVATAHALLTDRDFSRAYRALVRLYPTRSYGVMFLRWALTDNAGPYRSFGNGAAMRVSPVAYVSDSLEETLRLARSSAEVTHDHPEGIRGAQAIALAIYLARKGTTLKTLREIVQGAFGYNLKNSVDEIRKVNRYDETCQVTVPVALACVLESTSFEDALRNAVSVGGDTDTIAAIAGSIAETVHGIPEDIVQSALEYLDPDLKKTIGAFKDTFMTGQNG